MRRASLTPHAQFLSSKESASPGKGGLQGEAFTENSEDV